jgi:hypothetical protein
MTARPVHWVSLGNQSLDGASLIYVETFSRPRTDALVARSSQRPLQHVASYAAALPANVTLPVDTLPRPDGIYPALIGMTEEFSDKYADWPPVRWHVDGTAVTAWMWRFAGGWMAASDGARPSTWRPWASEPNRMAWRLPSLRTATPTTSTWTSRCTPR